MPVLALRNPVPMLKVFLVIDAIMLTLIGSACTPQTPATTPGPLIEVLEGTRPAIASFRVRPSNTPSPTSEVSASETSTDDVASTSTQATSGTSVIFSNIATPTPSSNSTNTPTQTPTSQNVSPPTLSSATRTPNATLPGTATPSPTSRPNQSPSFTPTRTSTSSGPGSTASNTPTPSRTPTASPTGPAITVTPNTWRILEINVVNATDEMYIYGMLESLASQDVLLNTIDATFFDSQGQEIIADDFMDNNNLLSIPRNGKTPFSLYVDSVVQYTSLQIAIESEDNPEGLHNNLSYSVTQITPNEEEIAYTVTGSVVNNGPAPVDLYIEVAIALRNMEGKIIGAGWNPAELPDEGSLLAGQSAPFEVQILVSSLVQNPTIEVYVTGF